MKVTDAVHQALLDAGGALTVSEITKRILFQGLWKSGGKTRGRWDLIEERLKDGKILTYNLLT